MPDAGFRVLSHEMLTWGRSTIIAVVASCTCSLTAMARKSALTHAYEKEGQCMNRAECNC